MVIRVHMTLWLCVRPYFDGSFTFAVHVWKDNYVP